MNLNSLVKQFALPEEGIIELDDLYDLTQAGLFRIKRIRYKKTKQYWESRDEIRVDDLSKAIVEDVLNNRRFYLNDDLSITEVGSQT